MNKKILKVIAIMFVLSSSLMACSNNQEAEMNKLRAENIYLQSELSLEKQLIEDQIKLFSDNIEAVASQIEALETKILTLEEVLVLNDPHEDLTDLSSYEHWKFEAFKINYDDEVLLGLEPIAICKMYLYALLIEDYDTVYELYTKDESGFYWTKEADEEYRLKGNMSDFSVFEDIYNLKVEINAYDEDNAVITWHSKNGYFDENIGNYIYSFALKRDGDIWKASFVPMQ